MDHTSYLLAANLVVWLGIGGYAFFLSRTQHRLEQRLHHLEIMRHDAEND